MSDQSVKPISVSNRFSRPNRVLLVGNYPLDEQESMDRFTLMLAQILRENGIECRVVKPRPKFGELWGRYTFSGLPKWLGYIDKYLWFPLQLTRYAKAGWKIHITDHSNAMYARKGREDVVTCHDMLAVRGALGEATDCPASATGRILQKWILRGLGRAGAICCVSETTARDVIRLLPRRGGGRVRTVPNALNYPYGKQSGEERKQRLARLGIEPSLDYVFHIGSNLARKNKQAILYSVALAGGNFGGKIVFAGPSLSTELKELAERLGLTPRVVEVLKPSSEDLEALYGGARVFLFPSRWEGFGWPIIEAQACGCPVVCGDQSALPEVAGDGAILCSPDDHDAFAAAIQEVVSPGIRAGLIERGIRNAARFSTKSMIQGYLEAYGMSDKSDGILDENAHLKNASRSPK